MFTKAGPAAWLSRTLILTLSLCALIAGPARSQSPERVSTLFEYRGYSSPAYNKWTRTSQYIKVRDGTRLAADIFRPEGAGATKMPVIWSYERYLRATVQNGTTITKLDREPWLREMLKHGYVVGVVEVRGTGASFGKWDGPFSQQEANDLYDVTEWFAAQEWCNQRVGMFGRSYMGIAQLVAAGAVPPHLKAIFPEMAAFDLYATAYTNGVYRKPFVEGWSNLIKQLDTSPLIAPVETSTNGGLLAEALAEHQQNRDFLSLCAGLPYRNSADALTRGTFFITRSPSAYLDSVNRSGVAIYLLAGWQDIWIRDAFLWFKNLRVPHRLVVGPWSHTRSDGFNLAAEHLRWFDYWLKDIDNGIKDEPPITYYTTNATGGSNWRTETRWPPAGAQETTFYFHGGGLLDETRPDNDGDQDTYRIDYSTSSGPASRWVDVYSGSFGYLDMRSNDERALTYTTRPLTSEVEVTGHPVVRLWVTSDTADSDFFVYLEDVSEDGKSQYITEGALKASHRAVSPAPFDYIGLPYHRSFSEDSVKLTADPAELAFDLYPTSYVFKKGHRIRVSITGADEDNAYTLRSEPAPTIHLYRGARVASQIVLPVIPATVERRVLEMKPSEGLTSFSHTEPALIPYRLVVLTVLTLGLLLAATVIFKRAIKHRSRN